MKVTSAKTIILTKSDLKDAVISWIYSKHVVDSEYGSILRMNDFDFHFDDEESYLMVSGDSVEYDSKDPK